MCRLPALPLCAHHSGQAFLLRRRQSRKSSFFAKRILYATQLFALFKNKKAFKEKLLLLGRQKLYINAFFNLI
jgi:hypothetical protein